MDKRRIGAILLGGAILAALLGFAVWQNESQRVEDAQVTVEIAASLTGREAENEPDRVPSYGLFALAGVAAICSAIFYSQTPDRDRGSKSRKDPG